MANGRSRFQFEVVTPAEDDALRAILRETSMPGSIALSFQREPSFFRAEEAGNCSSQTIAARDTHTGSLVGFGCRAIRRIFIEGEPRRVGYLSGLRCLPQYRGGTLLARAYRFLRELHADGQVDYYLTTILDGNQSARALLTSGRADLPEYRPVGRIITYLLPLYRRYGARPYVSTADLAGGFDCLSDHNRATQFSPTFELHDLTGASGLLPDFDARRFYVYPSATGVVATLAVWDQRSFKQTIVTGYTLPLRLAQPFSAPLSLLGVCPRLPRVGHGLPCLYASCLSFRPGHSQDLRALIHETLVRWSGQGHAYLIVGIDARHPLEPYLRELSSLAIGSGVYLVSWPGTYTLPLPLGNRLHGVEVALL